MSENKDHLSRAVIDNRDKQWDCEVCHSRPDTIAVIMRGGYVQEQLCSLCYTDRHPKAEIMVGEGVGSGASKK